MRTGKHIVFVFVFVLALLSTAAAQDGKSVLSQTPSLTITAAASSEQ